jgi:hypothetical protein
MTTLTQFAATPSTPVAIPSRARIARAVAFGLILVPLIMLESLTRESAFDTVAFGLQIAVVLLLFLAGGVQRRPRLRTIEYAALGMMLFADFRLWQAGPTALAPSPDVVLYQPLLGLAATFTAATLILLALQHRRA